MEVLEGTISSATAIRKYIFSSNILQSQLAPGDRKSSEIINLTDSLLKVLPASSFDILQREFAAGRGPVYSSDFDNTMLSILRRMNTEEISSLPYVSEGLENRIKVCADNSASLEELIDMVCTRRYTRTRIQRCLLNILTSLVNEEFQKFNLHGGPQYVRVLGFNDIGRQLLSKIKKSSCLPIIVKTADFKASCNPLLSRMLQIEAASTDQYSLSFHQPRIQKIRSGIYP